jgi:glycosyltransferase involved in cell wall biosynthesis
MNPSRPGHDRILHVPRRFVAHEWGGTETVIASLAQEQLRQGWRPEVHTSLALAKTPREEWNGVPVRRYRYCYPFFGLSAAQKLQMDKKGGNLLSLPLFSALALAGRVRIFHAHALKRLGGEVFTAAQIRKRPFVVTLHGGVFDVPAAELSQMMESQSGKLEWGKLFGALLRARKILEQADAVICVGRNEFEHAVRTLKHDRIHHLGNGVEPDRFADGDGEAFRHAHGIPLTALVLACYSRFDPQKDQLMLLTAFEALAAEFPMLYLLLAGPVTVPGYAEALDKRISASQFRSRIRRLGALPFTSKTMADAYQACDVFVLPSRHEPFGIVVLEAWSAGKPVAVSQVGGLQDLVTDDLDGLFFPSADPAGCSVCLRKLLLKPELRERLGAAGKRKAREVYSWGRIAEETERIYRLAENNAVARYGKS